MALVALAEGLSLIPSPQVVAHGHSQFQFQRTSSLLDSAGMRHTHRAHPYVQAKHTYKIG